MSKKNGTMSRKTLLKILEAVGFDSRYISANGWWFDYDTHTLYYRELERGEDGLPIEQECGHGFKERDAFVKLDATRFHPGEALTITKHIS